MIKELAEQIIKEAIFLRKKGVSRSVTAEAGLLYIVELAQKILKEVENESTPSSKSDV